MTKKLLLTIVVSLFLAIPASAQSGIFINLNPPGSDILILLPIDGGFSNLNVEPYFTLPYSYPYGYYNRPLYSRLPYDPAYEKALLPPAHGFGSEEELFRIIKKGFYFRPTVRTYEDLYTAPPLYTAPSRKENSPLPRTYEDLYNSSATKLAPLKWRQPRRRKVK